MGNRCRGRMAALLALSYVFICCVFSLPDSHRNLGSEEPIVIDDIPFTPPTLPPTPAPYKLPVRFRRPGAVSSGVIAGLALVALRVGLPRLKKRSRIAQMKQKKAMMPPDTFSKMLNLSKSELATAVFSGKMFNETMAEMDNSIPIILESLEDAMYTVGNWTTNEMGPATTPLAKLRAAVDNHIFYGQWADTRLDAVQKSSQSLAATARKLNMSQLVEAASEANRALEHARTVLKGSKDEFEGMSIADDANNFLKNVVQDFEKTKEKLRQSKTPLPNTEGYISLERLNEHTVTTKMLIVTHISNAVSSLRKVQKVGATLGEHLRYQHCWDVDSALMNSPIEERDYVKTALSEAAEHISLCKKSVLKGEPGPSWFITGLSMLERLNYYEGQAYTGLLGVMRCMEGLNDIADFYANLRPTANVRKWETELDNVKELLTTAIQSLVEIASRTHKRCAIAMEVVMTGDAEGSEESLTKRISWYQDSIAERLVTADQDAENYYTATKKSIDMWPRANTDIARLNKLD